jgi:hypothetical protein
MSVWLRPRYVLWFIPLVLVLGACGPTTSPQTSTPAGASSPLTAGAPQADATRQGLAKSSDELLSLHRKIIVLMDGEQGLPGPQRQRTLAIGLQLFHQLQAAQQRLISQTLDPAAEPWLDELLTRIETEPTWFDADRLAFREVLQAIANNQTGAQQLTRQTRTG